MVLLVSFAGIGTVNVTRRGIWALNVPVLVVISGG